MTSLTRNVRRKVETLSRHPLVVTLAPDGIWIRQPRKRIAYCLPYGVAFQKAAELFGMAEKRRKAQERKARRVAQ